MGPEVVGQDVTGAISLGQSFVGQDVVGQDVTGAKFLGQNVVGQEVVGQNVVGQNVVGQDATGAISLGQDVVGQDVVGQNFVGKDVAGAKSLGQVVMGQKVLGQEVGHLEKECFRVQDGELLQTPFSGQCLLLCDWIVLVFTGTSIAFSFIGVLIFVIFTHDGSGFRRFFSLLCNCVSPYTASATSGNPSDRDSRELHSHCEA